MTARPLLLLLLLAAATGCAHPSMYAWGKYDDALYKHYRNPGDREAWVAALKTCVLEAEQEGRKTPPGLLAEYGYALLEEGNSKEATVYFEKEKAKWPESAVLMDKMIRNAGKRAPKPPAATAPATRLESKR
jgi:hypothetical protein